MTNPYSPALPATQPGARAPGVGWMLGASSWLILVLFFGGWTTWVGFAIIGLGLMRVPWLVMSGVFLTAGIAAMVIGPGTAAGLLIFTAISIIGIILGLVANRTWLTVLWGRIERREPIFGRGARGAIRPQGVTPRVDPSLPVEAAALFAEPGTARSDYLAGPTAAGSAAPSAPIAVGERIDVNRATESQLAALPRIGAERARIAIAARHSQPFTSTQHFADVIGLQPHEFQAIRAQITYTPIVVKGRKRGRRLDL